MEQRLSLITLGVRDLARSRAFYADGMGWTPSELSNENIVFFQCPGVVFGLYGRDALAEDAALDNAEGSGFRGVTLAYNTRSKDEVDAVLAHAETIGAKIAKPAEDAFWGRLLRLFRRSRWASLGGRVESGLCHRRSRECDAAQLIYAATPPIKPFAGRTVMDKAQFLKRPDRGRIVRRAIGDDGTGCGVMEGPFDQGTTTFHGEAPTAMGWHDLIAKLNFTRRIGRPCERRRTDNHPLGIISKQPETPARRIARGCMPKRRIGGIIQALGKGGQLGCQLGIGEVPMNQAIRQRSRALSIGEQSTRKLTPDRHQLHARGCDWLGKCSGRGRQCPEEAGASADSTKWRPQ